MYEVLGDYGARSQRDDVPLARRNTESQQRSDTWPVLYGTSSITYFVQWVMVGATIGLIYRPS